MNLNATILAQVLIFSLVIWVTMKYLWPEITGSIQERSRRIAEGLAAAEQGRQSVLRAVPILERHRDG